MALQIVQVDAFTDQPFRGNPAAVCVLPEPRQESWMKDVAREMNLSETAFLVKRGNNSFDLRWFTPEVEVALCGHATLASAHALWESGQAAHSDPILFHTQSGVLSAARRADGLIELDFPQKPCEGVEPPPGLCDALGVKPVFAGKNVFDYLIEAESESVVRGLQPNFSAIAQIPVRGVMVTARSASPEFDFVSRFFAPASGVNEDPVTGSAHCCLGPYWAAKLGKTRLRAYQASARGGVLLVEIAGERVKLCGKALTIMESNLLY